MAVQVKRTRQVTLTNGRTVTESIYDSAQYHQACRACGGDLHGTAIWFCREARYTPTHVACPAAPAPLPTVEPRSQSVYAQRREDARQVAALEQLARQSPRPQFYAAGGLLWEDE